MRLKIHENLRTASLEMKFTGSEKKCLELVYNLYQLKQYTTSSAS